jgi:hypothetical protein
VRCYVVKACIAHTCRCGVSSATQEHERRWRVREDDGKHPLESQNAELRRRAERAETELAKAHKVIEVQGNVSALLVELLDPRGATLKGSTES